TAAAAEHPGNDRDDPHASARKNHIQLAISHDNRPSSRPYTSNAQAAIGLQITNVRNGAYVVPRTNTTAATLNSIAVKISTISQARKFLKRLSITFGDQGMNNGVAGSRHDVMISGKSTIIAPSTVHHAGPGCSTGRPDLTSIEIGC